jgi:glycosyltransferase involved in cell wall biosynthesis
MTPVRNALVRILVDSLADQGLTNSQMTNAREIIRRLDPEHFHVSVFCANDPDPAIKHRPNTRLVQLPKKRRTVRILREFVMGSHDIVFYLKSSPASKIYMGLRAKWEDRGVTVGTIESQSDLRNELTISPEAVRLWERTVLRCDYLFSNSRCAKESLLREYNLSSQIIPTGVDTRFFVPPSGSRDKVRPRILFVGSLRPFKQPQLLLDAAKRFPAADFAIAGTGEMLEQLNQRIEEERLSNAKLLGPLSAERLKLEYQKTDIFLFPSSWEGSPKVILEAAACGLPVIARQNYSPETVINGETGYLVASDHELFARLGELIDCPNQRRKFGEAGRRHSELFDWDPITRRWEEAFLDIMAQRAAAPHD